MSLAKESFYKGLNGGKAGSMAMGVNVVSLMWLRTTINYQYRHGTSTLTAFKTLYKDGGILRFYRGVLPALLQAPLSRFGDTACNTGIMHYLNNNPQTKDLNTATKTFAGSVCAGLWRVCLMPIDTTKTCLQVEGKNGLKLLQNRIRQNGIMTVYNGSGAACFATMIGHFPWFYTYNFLSKNVTEPDHNGLKLVRNASIGFCSSFSSDIVSNSARVLKVSRQSYGNEASYLFIVKDIIEKEGAVGLFGRGLKTKIIANGINGMLFAVLWKYFQN